MVFVGQVFFPNRYRPHGCWEATAKCGIRLPLIIFSLVSDFSNGTAIRDGGVRAVLYVRACGVGGVFYHRYYRISLVICREVMCQCDSGRHQAFQDRFSPRSNDVSVKERVRSYIHSRVRHYRGFLRFGVVVFPIPKCSRVSVSFNPRRKTRPLQIRAFVIFVYTSNGLSNYRRERRFLCARVFLLYGFLWFFYCSSFSYDFRLHFMFSR